MFGTASLSVCTLCFKEDTCQSGTILPVSLMKTRKKTEGSFLMAVLFIKSSLGSDSCLLVLSLYHLVMLPVLQISSQLSVMSLLSPVLWSITLSTKNDTNTDYVSHFNLSLLFFYYYSNTQHSNISQQLQAGSFLLTFTVFLVIMMRDSKGWQERHPGLSCVVTSCPHPPYPRANRPHPSHKRMH